MRQQTEDVDAYLDTLNRRHSSLARRQVKAERQLTHARFKSQRELFEGRLYVIKAEIAEIEAEYKKITDNEESS